MSYSPSRILRMPPGEEIDRLVWLHVLDGEPGNAGHLGAFRPSRNVEQALGSVASAMPREFVLSRGTSPGGWRAEFRRSSGRWIDAEGETAALAICRAAILVALEAA